MRFRLANSVLVLVLATGGAAAIASAQPRRPIPMRPKIPGAGIIERLNRMSPEQRRRAMEKLPPERKKAIEQRMEQYNNLSPEERQRLRDQYEHFQDLPPERQEGMRKVFRRFNNLPPDRRRAVLREIELLRDLPESDRRARLNSDEFRDKFRAPEREMLQDFSHAMPNR